MEENQRKGPGVFYAVVGVATLVVAIIGATFAYFSASTGVNSGTIQGQTQNIDGSSLTLNVKKVVFTGATADYTTLVPAFFGVDSTKIDAQTNPQGLNVKTPAELTNTQLGSMLTNKCVNNGFTGCHVYRIEISANQNVTHANLLLGLTVSDNGGTGTKAVVDKSQWGYAIFTADGTVNMTTGETAGLSNGTLMSEGFGVPAAIGNGVTVNELATDIHHNGALTVDANNNNAPNVVVYYLLVYVNDTNVSQNNVDGSTGDANYVVGSYTGTLELQALGGKVRASFTA